MNKLLREQIDLLIKTLDFQVDGKPTKEVPESFSNITFFQSGHEIKNDIDKLFIFEDYIVKPFKGFDFHDKFNNGVAPPELVMSGKILKETEKMFYIFAHTSDNMKF